METQSSTFNSIEDIRKAHHGKVSEAAPLHAFSMAHVALEHKMRDVFERNSWLYLDFQSQIQIQETAGRYRIEARGRHASVQDFTDKDSLQTFVREGLAKLLPQVAVLCNKFQKTSPQSNSIKIGVAWQEDHTFALYYREGAHSCVYA